MNQTPSPVELTYPSPYQIRIKWDDGHESVYEARELRFHCPCASCVNEITRERTIRLESIPEDVRPLKAKWVGRYAVEFKWSDNHSTGIYPFSTLRSLCPCPHCR